MTAVDKERALDIGRRWAQALAPRLEETTEEEDLIDSLLTVFRTMGLDPLKMCAPSPADETIAGTVIQLNACPLVNDGEQPSDFVCAVHESYLRETLDSQLEGKLRLKLFPRSQHKACDIIAKPAAIV